MMPWRLAYWPVTMDARLGEQSGVVWNALRHIAPSRASRSTWGVRPELVEAQVVDEDDEEVRTLDRRGRRHAGSLARPVRDSEFQST
jgi:hypothetical protein